MCCEDFPCCGHDPFGCNSEERLTKEDRHLLRLEEAAEEAAWEAAQARDWESRQMLRTKGSWWACARCGSRIVKDEEVDVFVYLEPAYGAAGDYFEGQCPSCGPVFIDRWVL